MSWYVEGKDFETELKEGKYEILIKPGIKNVIDIINNKDKEIERLNNIINKFNKWLLGEQMMYYKGTDGETLIRYRETVSKWLELKGDGSNENK